eukprot:380973-Prymnesium_polylepis.2
MSRTYVIRAVHADFALKQLEVNPRHNTEVGVWLSTLCANLYGANLYGAISDTTFGTGVAAAVAVTGVATAASAATAATTAVAAIAATAFTTAVATTTAATTFTTATSATAAITATAASADDAVAEAASCAHAGRHPVRHASLPRGCAVPQRLRAGHHRLELRQGPGPQLGYAMALPSS